MKWKLTVLLAAATAMIINCCGCTKIGPGDPEGGYSTTYPLSAVDYNIFISKQISIASNVLMTRMEMAKSISSGEGEVDIGSEIDNTDEAITKMQTIRGEVSITMPAITYETDHTTTLALIDDSVDALNSYKSALEEKDSEKVADCAEQIKNCVIALTGEANAYYI